MPGVVLEAAVMVMVEVPEPGAANETGLKAIVTPAGCPETMRETGAENPFITTEVTVAVLEPANATWIVDAEVESANSGMGTGCTANATVVL